ncbi:MAG: heavy metal translocating P-type ATPase [Rhodospirillales bacterium CG15_BIG_FIL_POST_REV_8_21_14_020_66_15]|nr:MAG: heavy metal translocating P-type ATPase [Rhodospirillales bacterium CG15_BIG_FIL_POST_REV_8_21_14_020_66_15]
MTQAQAAALALNVAAEAAPAPPETLHLMVENVHCAGCIKRIEGTLAETPGVVASRVNLSTKRLRVDWLPGATTPDAITEAVANLGFPARPFDPARLEDGGEAEDKRLLKAMAVAGFAAANVMLLSVSVWSGHVSGMGGATRDLFHWVSALIALPAVVYAGMPFFKSAASALASRALNMDVPISLAVILAAGMSLQQTMKGAEHAYFDASVTLLFFLLIGRYLDRRARTKARSAATRLLGLRAATAMVVDAGGRHRAVATADLAPGMVLAVAAGERLAADGEIVSGRTDLDSSLVTGESLPRAAGTGDAVYAGTLNLTGPVEVRITAAGEETLLAEIVRLMEAAEQGRARYVRLADRAARIYAPAVHILSAGTFIGWFVALGQWEPALMTAVAVLIITCPCALGLAVPAVQVVASGRLLQRGVLVKAADGLERVAQCDTVVFDKTGTLTLGEPALVNGGDIPADTLRLAAALAARSRHPLARALVKAASDSATHAVDLREVEEIPGQGLSAVADGRPVRLGSRSWCRAEGTAAASGGPAGPEFWLAAGGDAPVRFAFADTLRDDARDAIDRIKAMGLAVELLSGDRENVVRGVADELGIPEWRAQRPPDAKVRRLKDLAARGRKVLMVGDGLNDAPALAAGHASLSPSSAADISQTAADMVFQGRSLAAVAEAVAVARAATRHVKQNFALALLYNVIAVPIAVAGLATPLVAAVAMSSSSILVTLNALRLKLVR